MCAVAQATFNEPNSILGGYQGGGGPPLRCSDRSRCKEGDDRTEPWLAGHTILLAHAAAFQQYRGMNQTGRITIVLDGTFGIPYSQSEADVQAAYRLNIFTFAHWADPVHLTGDYPAEMKAALGSRLPAFTETEKTLLKFSADFYALNHYTSIYVRNDPKGGDCNCTQSATNASGHLIGPQAASEWLHIFPPGIRMSLNFQWNRYHAPLVITENGVDVMGEANMTLAEEINDVVRVEYLREYLHQISLAIDEDNIPVLGYHLWSVATHTAG